MTYQVSYGNEPNTQRQVGVRTEYYPTEHEALSRARTLFEDGNHAVSITEKSRGVLTGFRLQLRLGGSPRE